MPFLIAKKKNNKLYLKKSKRTCYFGRIKCSDRRRSSIEPVCIRFWHSIPYRSYRLRVVPQAIAKLCISYTSTTFPVRLPLLGNWPPHSAWPLPSFLEVRGWVLLCLHVIQTRTNITITALAPLPGRLAVNTSVNTRITNPTVRAPLPGRLATNTSANSGMLNSTDRAQNE